MPAPKKATQTKLNQFFTPLADTSKKQTLLTKFFSSSNPTENKFQYLFEREEARKEKEREELARRAEEEANVLKLQKQEERKRRAEERKKLQAELNRQMEEDQHRRWEEEEKRYEGKLIIPGLYLGSRLAAKNPDWLLHSVTAVLNVSQEVKNYFEGSFVKHSSETTSDENDQSENIPSSNVALIEYKRISCEDAIEEQINRHFAEGSEFIDKVLQNHGSVLVHCREGMSRSPSMILAYLMKYQQWSLEKAYNHVVTCNGKLRINDGFKMQLMAYEQKLFGQSTLEFFDKRSRSGTTRTSTRLRRRQSSSQQTDSPSVEPLPTASEKEDERETHTDPLSDALEPCAQTEQLISHEPQHSTLESFMEDHTSGDIVMSDPGTVLDYEPVVLNFSSTSLPELGQFDQVDFMQTD
jgi:protein-tyrosine phosphatase